MQTMRFDLRDLLRAPRLAFSLQRMWIQWLGMGIGYLIYLVLTYASFMLQGHSIKQVWQQSGLLPCLFTQLTPITWYSAMTYGLALFFLIAAFLFTNTAVARAGYMTLKDNHFYSWREAFAFARKKFLSILFAPISLLILILLILFASLILGWLGRIPYVGELGISFFTLFWFLGALFVIYTAVVTVVSIWHTPGIIAASDEDAFEAVFQSFSLTWTQPWRLLLYQVFNLVIALAAMAFFAFVVKKSLLLMNFLLASFMGHDYVQLSCYGMAWLQHALTGADKILAIPYGPILPQIFFAKEVMISGSTTMPATVVVSAYLFAASLLFIAGWVFSYGLTCYTMGNLMTFLALRHRKDGENLLARKDKEEEQEDAAATDESQPATVSEPQEGSA